jgi:hypothetical protein
MSNFTAPICLEPRFSKRFAFVLMVMHGGALLLLLPLTLPLGVESALVVKLCIGLLVLASALHTLRRHLRLINHPLFRCILRYDETLGCIRAQLKSGQETRIASGSYSHPQWVVLKLDGFGDALIIFSDALDVQTLRWLRVHLRYADDPPQSN